MNDKVIDIRGKDKNKVLEGYKIAANESKMQEEIWEQTKSFDKALALYMSLNKKNGNNESSDSKTKNK